MLRWTLENHILTLQANTYFFRASDRVHWFGRARDSHFPLCRTWCDSFWTLASALAMRAAALCCSPWRRRRRCGGCSMRGSRLVAPHACAEGEGGCKMVQVGSPHDQMERSVIRGHGLSCHKLSKRLVSTFGTNSQLLSLYPASWRFFARRRSKPCGQPWPCHGMPWHAMSCHVMRGPTCRRRSRFSNRHLAPRWHCVASLQAQHGTCFDVSAGGALCA